MRRQISFACFFIKILSTAFISKIISIDKNLIRQFLLAQTIFFNEYSPSSQWIFVKKYFSFISPTNCYFFGQQFFFSYSYYIMDQDLQLYKIVLIGNSGTGKTNITMRYINGEFAPQSKASVGVQFFAKVLPIAGKNIKITLWDTAGQQRYKSLSKVYYKGARGILAVYDITEPQSYVDIQQWLRFANDAISLSDITVFVVGNKDDLEKDRKVTLDRALRQYKDTFDVDCWEVSAKSGHNINQMFTNMFQKIHQKGLDQKSSVCYQSELATYSQIERDSQSLVKKQQNTLGKTRPMEPIDQIIVEQLQQISSPPKYTRFQKESRMTLTNADELQRLEQKNRKKKCCKG